MSEVYRTGSSFVAILAHLMDSRGVLNQESSLRVAAAVAHDKEAKCDYFVTSGWAYRQDSSIAIANAVAQALTAGFGVDHRRILVDCNARDTVGDAFFIRRKLRTLSARRIVVVTSDYHTDRTRIIFERFFSPEVDVECIGAFTGLQHSEELRRHEVSSIEAFHKTFAGINVSDDDEVLEALGARHPFYNGEIFDRLDITAL